ncbi:MAG: helix-turn-helix transcriptional regulator [Candidatus Saccharibacteria bacterium]|nr:helix-turn-helix transcriptional regulator [Microbacteriaceae bacterium]
MPQPRARIVELRQAHGWTQDRLATASGVGIRTIQRLEAGEDASLEPLSLVADALRVPVRDLFTVIEDADLSGHVESLQIRALEQQAARDRLTSAWRWLYIGIGVILTVIGFTLGHYGLVLFHAYWTGGFLILVAVRRIHLEPRLEERYPLSRSHQQLRARRTKWKMSEMKDGRPAS